MLEAALGVKGADGISKVPALLDRFMDHMEEIDSADAKPIIEALFSVGDKLLSRADRDGAMFGFGNETRVGRIAYHLLKKVEPAQRSPLLINALNQANALRCSQYLIVSVLQEAEKAAKNDGDSLVPIAEVQALKDQMLRVAADAENAKRRAEREANDARAFAIQKFGRDLLTVADTLDRALAAPVDDPAVKNFVVGMEMTQKSLMSAFENNGLMKIDPPKGEKFDPHQHQAMMEQAAPDVAAGGVIQVLQPGYELLGRLIRPAMVVVAAKGSGADLPPAAAEAAPAANPYAANDGEAGGSVDTKA